MATLTRLGHEPAATADTYLASITFKLCFPEQTHCGTGACVCGETRKTIYCIAGAGKPEGSDASGRSSYAFCGEISCGDLIGTGVQSPHSQAGGRACIRSSFVGNVHSRPSGEAAYPDRVAPVGQVYYVACQRPATVATDAGQGYVGRVCP